MDATNTDSTRRPLVRRVALLNLSYFGVEFAVALSIGSVSLLADSIDFLEDTSINFLIFAALGWSAVRRARVGMALGGILLVPGLATLWTAWDKFNFPVPPDTVPLSLAGAGALAVKSRLRLHARPLPHAWRQSHPCRLLVRVTMRLRISPSLRQGW